MLNVTLQHKRTGKVITGSMEGSLDRVEWKFNTLFPNFTITSIKEA